jgi:hypothetical protein
LKKEVREKGFLIAKIPSIKGFPPKRPETTTSCGLEKSHPRRDSHQKVRMIILRKRMSKDSPMYSHSVQIVEKFFRYHHYKKRTRGSIERSQKNLG